MPDTTGHCNDPCACNLAKVSGATSVYIAELAETDAKIYHLDEPLLRSWVNRRLVLSVSPMTNLSGEVSMTHTVRQDPAV